MTLFHGYWLLLNKIRHTIPVRVEVLDDAGLLLTLTTPRFSLIVFESIRSYFRLDGSARDILLNYCKTNKVGIISFLKDLADASDFREATSIEVKTGQQVTNVEFDTSSRIPYVGRKGIKLPIESEIPSGWTVFYPGNSSWKPYISCLDSAGDPAAVAIHSEYSETEHIIFGKNLNHFFMKIGFWDSLIYMLRGSPTSDLDTFIQIDIDDIFVGHAGTRLIPEDIQSLIESQDFLRQYIEDFNYTLGFSGHFFKKGDPIENLADELLISQAENFLWFPHMWHHNHAHEYELTYLLALMTQNEFFAKNFNFRTILRYAVSPQHSGVYPVHEPLYEAWKQVWNVSVTSTEEYPHLKPAWNRRGFVHNGISVLPRQTCGLFTHTHFFHAYPEGINQLKKNIFGGDLFTTILLNKFLIFMTHQQNFGNDRLAQYTFHNEVLFLKCWTNLNLKWKNPTEMAKLYFEKYPEEKKMIYTDPCDDVRHKKMLSVNSTCGYRLPNVIIVGPQKTGTSALLSFLKLHPNVTSNINVEKSFEELQFFNLNYEKGLNWYISKFRPSESHSIILEKTANYFDNPTVPDLVHSLVPEAKIVVLLLDPADRAYSWYHHMRSHNDSIALKFDPEELFSMDFKNPNYEISNKLRQRCLRPGHYAENLDFWLDYYPPSQILLLDAGLFRKNPISTLNFLSKKLDLPSNFNFSENLKFNFEKNFYCGYIDGKSKCLGASKGRKYPTMSESLRKILNFHFEPHNRALLNLLKKYKFEIPEWLRKFA